MCWSLLTFENSLEPATYALKDKRVTHIWLCVCVCVCVCVCNYRSVLGISVAGKPPHDLCTWLCVGRRHYRKQAHGKGRGWRVGWGGGEWYTCNWGDQLNGRNLQMNASRDSGPSHNIHFCYLEYGSMYWVCHLLALWEMWAMSLLYHEGYM